MMGNYHARCGAGEKPEVETPEAYLSLFGQIPNFDKLIATIRSREISASIILQSQSQLKAIYKDAAEIISDNCDCTLFLSGRGKNAKEISDVLGKETIDSYNQSENRGAQTSHGLNYQKLGKPYTEDMLLSAMERAGAEDMPEDAERQGLGTPATRASILEKLVQMGFVERKGKQLLPTKDGHNLVCVLPDVLTSPQLTAEWETKLTAIAKGEADPDGFMVGIEEMTRSLISRYSQISEDAQKLFQSERVVIGKCPRCGEAVYEGKKNYYCGNRACQFVMWKNDRFFEERGKTFTSKIAAALLKDGKAKVKGLRSMKTGKTYDGTVLLADTGGKYVNYRVEKRS